ncbi:MAG: DUF4388 domain-containing protein [Chthoniobacterales bacterium]
MQLLAVHSDAEVGEQLVRMVADYTAHSCELVASDAAALEWAARHHDCALLLTQLAAPGVDGLALGGSLGEYFSGLQTIFLPNYRAADQRLQVTNPKVFAEPIDGEQLLKAIDRAVATPYPGLDLFHVVDILQMCCLSSRSGAIQIVKSSRTALVYLRDGQIVHAERAALRGLEALVDMISWESVEFAYDESVRAETETITEKWDEALIEAVLRHKEQASGGGAKLRETHGEASGLAEKFPPPKRRFFGALRKS